MRAVATLAALAGGLCWIGAVWVPPLAVVGAALLAVAVLAAGAGLVSRSATWLRVLVAVCFLALVGSVLQVLRDSLDPDGVLAAAGIVAVLAAAGAHSRRPRRPAPRTRSRGAHAA